MGWQGASKLKLAGIGPPLGQTGMLTPGRFESGELVLENCPIVVTDAPTWLGTDGIVPLALFESFLVRLDVPGKTLDLHPYPGEVEAGGFTEARADRQLLFLQAT